MTETTTETRALHAPFAAWRDAALADGWTEVPNGVWGVQKQPLEHDPVSGSYVIEKRYDGDLTVLLVKDDMQVWLVDRTGAWDRHELWTSGWFNNGLTTMGSVPEVYDAAAIEALRGKCDKCGQAGDPKRLTPIGFTGKVCPTCDTPAYRNQIEFPGWTN